ncbi:HAD hydrolase family protein [Streptomyces sp. NPDC091278]|uniref:HAD hydrolase family protein n=1 Tax=Streptomyces sp. NPDC091278 TaxID=3155301 RepID=UPI00344BDAC4
MHIVNFAYECGGFDPRLMRGGLSPLVWNLSREYAALGHRVSVVTPAHGHLERLRAVHRIEELDHRIDHTVPLVLDPKTWPDRPAELSLSLSTRAHLLRLDGVDVYFLSDTHLDLLPDRLYPPPDSEGRELSFFKPLVFQVAGLRFLRDVLGAGHGEGAEPAIVHGFEPAYHHLVPLVLRDDPRWRCVSTVAANAPVTHKVYRPQTEAVLRLFGVDPLRIGAGSGEPFALDAWEEPAPPEGSATAAMVRALAATRLHTDFGPDHVSLFPQLLAHADLVDFVSPGQLDHHSTFEGTPMERYVAGLPVARLLRERAGKLFDGGCGVSGSWLARDPAAVDRDAVLRGMGLDPARPVFYHAARYAVHHKGQLELVRAVEEVLADGAEVSFVLRCATGAAGTAPAAPANAYFQRVADAYPDRVRLDWSLVGEEELFTEAACADFCVYPSKFELDGFLIAQAEAMACGAVPIGTAQRTTAHFGHALPHDDPDATGFAVRGSFRDDDRELAGLLADRFREAERMFREAPREYRRLSGNAVRTARGFTWGESARRRLGAFRELLDGAPRALPARDAVRYGWFGLLGPAELAEHREAVLRRALETGDADAYGRCAELDGDAYGRLFAAAYRRADFERCAALARDAGRDDWLAPVRHRCRIAAGAPDAVRAVEYRHPGPIAVDVVVDGAGPAVPGPVDPADEPLESAAEAARSDEPVPSAGTTRLVALRRDADGVFRGTVPSDGSRGGLVLRLTLGDGGTAWDHVPVPGAPPYRVVATDLDGTLLRADLTVSARTRRALGLVAVSGAAHLVVTGRPAAACRELFGSLEYTGLAVCGQGAQVYDAGADRLLSAERLDTGLARSVVARLEELLGPLELGVVTSPPESRFKVTPGFGERVRHGWDVTADRAGLWDGPIDKLVLHHRTVGDDALTEAALRLCGDEVTVVHSVRGMVEVLPLGVTKGTGVARALELLGRTGAETVAFGDMPNDLPLLALAGHGVAVANAHPSLRAVADEIAPGHEEDGVAAVLERLFGTPVVPFTAATGREGATTDRGCASMTVRPAPPGPAGPEAPAPPGVPVAPGVPVPPGSRTARVRADPAAPAPPGVPAGPGAPVSPVVTTGPGSPAGAVSPAGGAR